MVKVLYGVQGTGNGHISRARALGPALREAGVEVDFLFSGRPAERYFDMDVFGAYRTRRGLSFATRAGGVQMWETLRNNRPLQLMRDIKSLDLGGYDVVISDFEPVTAWAARQQKVYCVGMGHQYAFAYPVPKAGESWWSRRVLRNFAPADIGVGLHWHHFGQPILPPIADVPHGAQPQAALDPNKILVYLGFEDSEDVIAMLEAHSQYTFVYYGPFSQFESLGHIQLKPLSRPNFQDDLMTCAGVICNAGFELSSEALQLGKKLLVKPLSGQMEQVSNALALEQLQLGMSMHSLDSARVGSWLRDFEGRRVHYPDVAAAIATWIAAGQWHSCTQLVEDLWARVDMGAAPAQRSSIAA